MSIKDRVWRWLEPSVQAVVTERLLIFHDALVEREQIRRAYPPGPTRENAPPKRACRDCDSVKGDCGAHE